MRTYDLDCRRMTDRAALHAHLREVLPLPGYYGNNLDALYDCLTELAEPTTLRFAHPDALKALGGYYMPFFRTLLDAEREDEGRLRVVFYDPEKEGAL